MGTYSNPNPHDALIALIANGTNKCYALPILYFLKYVNYHIYQNAAQNAKNKPRLLESSLSKVRKLGFPLMKKKMKKTSQINVSITIFFTNFPSKQFCHHTVLLNDLSLFGHIKTSYPACITLRSCRTNRPIQRLKSLQLFKFIS